MDINSLAHTKWNCKYHIVFAPKYRRKIIYGQLKRDIANILSMLCKRKGVKIVEAEVCPDHIHMLVEIPPSISVSSFVGYLKGKSTLMIFERHANLKYKYGNRHFWCRGYYVDTVGKNAKKIQEYIQNQLKEDLEYDQMTLKEYSKGIYVKFKPEEVEILHNRMKEAGVQNMSAYIRKMALNGYVIIPEWPDLNQVISFNDLKCREKDQQGRCSDYN